MVQTKVSIDGVIVVITDMWIQGGDLYFTAKNEMSGGSKDFQAMSIDWWIEMQTGEECHIEAVEN